MTELIVELSRIKLWVASVALPDPDYGDSDYSEISKSGDSKKTMPIKHKKDEDEEWFAQQKEKKKQNETTYYACDKKSELYVLQQDFIQHNRGYSLDEETNGSW